MEKSSLGERLRIADEMLNRAHGVATMMSGCTKVKVGAVLCDKDMHMISFGANRAVPSSCIPNGCMRVALYGDNSKDHRGPADCRAIHSEIDAIASAARKGAPTEGGTLYVTRYPCEACARAIVAAGIKAVIYGRKQNVSDETIRIFMDGGVTCTRCDSWDAEDTTN